MQTRIRTVYDEHKGRYGYLSPAAHRLMALLQARGEHLFKAWELAGPEPRRFSTGHAHRNNCDTRNEQGRTVKAVS